MVLEAGVELYTNTVVSACQMADGRVTPEELWRQVMALRPFQRQE